MVQREFIANITFILHSLSCEWLFPILERVEELSVPRGSERADRYIGYMGETLETLYFMANSNKLNIVHTEFKLLY